jgi:hypothetical protein
MKLPFLPPLEELSALTSTERSRLKKPLLPSHLARPRIVSLSGPMLEPASRTSAAVPLELRSRFTKSSITPSMEERLVRLPTMLLATLFARLRL